MNMRNWKAFCSAAVISGVLWILPASIAAQEAVFDSDTISGLGSRNIGSAAMSGRIAAVTAVKEDGRLTVYVGAASGGVWKSVNGGTTYKPVFDKQPVQSIGAIAIDPQAPKTVWVGTGESWTRNSVSVGDGIYKSTDGGENWNNVGLRDSERIAKILIDPKDGNMVYACVPGKLWSDSDERGVYKTTDGGKTWSKILKGSNASTGCSMISMSSQDSKTLFAGMWDFRRKGWTFRSGGENSTAPSGSGLFQSTDGGSTWKELDEKSAKGLPAKPWGRVAVSIAPSNPSVIYTLIESNRSALFRSGDGGKTWEEGDRSSWMVWRPFYFANLLIDPKNENKLYEPDLVLIMSEDGGKSFSSIIGGAHGDFHDVWINPENTNHLIAGDDGGIWYSYDSGNTWWKAYNLPVSQFYHVSVDMQDPYHVFGGLQDNSAWMGDSSYPGGITNSRWENLYGGDGFWVFPDPADSGYVYAEAQGGTIGRIRKDPKSISAIKVFPAAISDTARIRGIAHPCAVILQAAEHVVGILHVHAHVIKLRDRQVVGLPPGVPAVVRIPNTAVVPGDQMIRVLRIDPHVMEIAVCAPDNAAETLAAILAHDEHEIRLVQFVFVLWIDQQVRKIKRAPHHPTAAVTFFPGLAAIA